MSTAACRLRQRGDEYNPPYHRTDRTDRIRTALLIIHGREDRAWPATQAEMMFSVPRRLRRTAQLSVYDGYGHVISRWEPERAVNAACRVLDFL